LLDGVFNAFQSTIQKASGRLYGALPFGSADRKGLLRDSIAWFAIKPSVESTGHPSASIFKQGYVAPSNGYSLLNPAFGLDNPARAPWALPSPIKARTCPADSQVPVYTKSLKV
jgi:hypothetical protein